MLKEHSVKLKRKKVEILETNKATIQLVEQFTQTVNQTKYHDSIEPNDYNFTNKLMLSSDFNAFNNQSAVSIAFHAKQYKTFVLLKSRGFHQFWYEEPLSIDSLSEWDKLALKQAMGDFLRKNNY